MVRFRSIIARMVALHVLAIGVTSILMPLALYWLLNEAANNLHRDALRSQAYTIGTFLRPQPDGRVTLEIPMEVRPLYSGRYSLYDYAVLDDNGRTLFSSRLDGAALFTPDEQSVRDWFLRRSSSGAVLF
ncbi:MAG: two-component sensor histidine kinase, partial [Proteobacteria bacterium]|nr:two-component sensor histidine kinase [Pseudomonadota bacterium]